MADIPGRRIEPSIHILDSRFKYVNAASTDIRKTFERIRAAGCRGRAQQGPPHREVRMSRLPSYTHFTDAELLRECGQHYADGLIVELAKRLAEVADERDALEADVERLERQINDLEEERDMERERADNAELIAEDRLEQIRELEQLLAAK